MRHSPKAIANHFLSLARASGQPISPMKLQKLVYYAHGWYAGHTGQPLIDETVEAWPYGPVIPSLYHEFKRFGASDITRMAMDLDGQQLREVPPPDDPSLRQFLDNVWSSYGPFTGIRLSEMTHAPGGPWDETWKESAGMRGTDIPFQRIAEHFRAAADKARQRSTKA